MKHYRKTACTLVCLLILPLAVPTHADDGAKGSQNLLDRPPEPFSDEDESQLLGLREKVEAMRQLLLTRAERFTREEILKMAEEAQPIFAEIDRLQHKRDRWEAYQRDPVNGQSVNDKPPSRASKPVEDEKAEAVAQAPPPVVSLFTLQPGMYSKAQVVDLLGPVDPTRKLQPFNAATERYALRRVMVGFDTTDQLQAIALFFRTPLPPSDVELLFPMQYRPVEIAGDPFGGPADTTVTLHSVADGLGYICADERVTAIIRTPRERALSADLFGDAIVYATAEDCESEVARP